MKNKKKIISYILGISIFISSFKLEFKGILNRDKVENKKEKETIASIETIDNNLTEPTIKIDNEIYETSNEKKQEEIEYETNTNYN